MKQLIRQLEWLEKKQARLEGYLEELATDDPQSLYPAVTRVFRYIQRPIIDGDRRQLDPRPSLNETLDDAATRLFKCVQSRILATKQEMREVVRGEAADFCTRTFRKLESGKQPPRNVVLLVQQYANLLSMYAGLDVKLWEGATHDLHAGAVAILNLGALQNALPSDVQPTS